VLKLSTTTAIAVIHCCSALFIMEIYFYIILFLIDVIGYAFWVTLTEKTPKGWKEIIPFCWIFS